MSTNPISIALGEVFPPRTAMEIEAYRYADVLAGFMDWEPDQIPPGPNHAPGYRWGWQNRERDSHPERDDGFDRLRHELIRVRKEHHGHVGPIAFKATFRGSCGSLGDGIDSRLGPLRR